MDIRVIKKQIKQACQVILIELSRKNTERYRRSSLYLALASITVLGVEYIFNTWG